MSFSETSDSWVTNEVKDHIASVGESSSTTEWDDLIQWWRTDWISYLRELFIPRLQG